MRLTKHKQKTAARDSIFFFESRNITTETNLEELACQEVSCHLNSPQKSISPMNTFPNWNQSMFQFRSKSMAGTGKRQKIERKYQFENFQPLKCANKMYVCVVIRYFCKEKADRFFLINGFHLINNKFL